jgi:energy-coupling factor transporter ATP-binding protein EcfA2
MDQRFHLPEKWNKDTDGDKERIAVAYIETAQQAGIGILAITEHNDLTYAPLIREAARGTGVTVFPGVEFSLPPKLHLIALFEPDADIDGLWDLIVKLGLGKKASERFHPDRTPKQITGTLPEFLRKVEEYGGLVIAPHACSQAGLLTLPEGQARVDAWKQEGILAADPGGNKRVSDLGKFERAAFEGTHEHYRRSRPMPPVWTSDARSFVEIGCCYTWLKLSSLALEGLRQAFLDPESRIRHRDEYTGVKYPRVLGMGWQGPGFLTNQVVAFSDNLNCLIGGKGVGKSSVIETLRFAFGLEPPADMRDATRNHLKSVLPSGGTVTVVIESQGPRKLYAIERTQGGYAPVVKDDSGKIVPDVSPLDLLQPSIFGQKEIYEIAQEPSDQLKALDDFLAARIAELGADEAAIKKELEKNAAALDALHTEKGEIADQVADLPRLQQLKKRYEELGIVSKLERKTKFQANLRRLKRVKTKLEEFLSAIEGLDTGLSSEYDALPKTDPLQDQLLQAKGLLDETAKEWKASLAAVRTSVAGRITVLDGLLIQGATEAAAVDEEFKAISEEIHKEYPEANIDEYMKLQGQIEAIAPLQKKAEQKAARIATLQTDRRALLDRLLAVRRTRYNERHDKAQELTARLEKALRIHVKFEGRLDVIRSGLEALKSGIRKIALDALFQHPNFSLPALLAAIDGGVDELKERFSLTDAAAGDLAKALDGRTRLDWDAFDVPDAIEIEFNVSPAGAEPQYRPLGTLSVGQKSTAILLLLLLKDDNPFVVDQPEDDLDNRFIYEDIVQRLRSAKEQRQFIVATHNANIPVLGDAEQIVVLNASNNQGMIERTGSIDDRAIQSSVKDILEGGESAFEMRKKKYGF